MGFKYSEKGICCPYFKNLVNTTGNKFIGIECLSPNINLGFETTRIVRLKNMAETNDYIEIFCKDCYDTCPYFKYNEGQAN
jgi:hypothetical protein